MWVKLYRGISQVHANDIYLEVRNFQKVSPKFNLQIMYKLATWQQMKLFLHFYMLL